MTKKTDPAGLHAQVRKAEPMDLSDVTFRNKNTHDPEVVLYWGSYTAESNALGSVLISEVAVTAHAGNPKPDFLTLGKIEEDSNDVPGAPTTQKSRSTIPVRWVLDGTRAKLDMKKLLMVRRFPIPKGTRARVPISAEFVEGLGHCVTFHFGLATFEAVEERPPKAKQSVAKSKAPEPTKAEHVAAAQEPSAPPVPVKTEETSA